MELLGHIVNVCFKLKENSFPEVNTPFYSHQQCIKVSVKKNKNKIEVSLDVTTSISC